MKNASAIVHIGPALGAAFTEYTAEFEPKGELGNTSAQRFIYVMEGVVALELKGKRQELGARGYAYLPEGISHKIIAREKSRAVVVEKFYERIDKAEPPRLMVSSEDDISSHALDGDSDLQVKCLLPDEPSFDFAVNTMVYQPGAALSMVEIHVMEHGLIMLEGGGIYRLGDSWYPVTAGGFVWVWGGGARWVGGIGKGPIKNLIYKNLKRHTLRKSGK